MQYSSRKHMPFTPRRSPDKTRSGSPYVAPQPGLGYFAFPPPGSPITDYQRLTNITFGDPGRENAPASSSTKTDNEWEAEQERLQERRERMAAREAEEARHGEEEWVRSGGILRDSEGRRDYARTEEVKAELRLREEEKKLAERWENYEAKWAELVKGGGSNEVKNLTFVDIPWPVDVGRSVELSDLTVKNIEKFLLAPLKIRNSKVTKKERLRSSVLRWHPDKMTGILGRVVKGDVDKVEMGINLVAGSIQKIHRT
ncbi:hypothetical protein BDQ17DRAFT_270230 [Cyathus striatus]|nr:hypothetical protein BDQ17DRAFT_270230 [Cyathus striatus]